MKFPSTIAAPIILAWSSILVAIGPTQPSAADDVASGASETSSQDLIERFCVECHGGDDAEAGLRLDLWEEWGSHNAMPRLKRILRTVRSGVMPPDDAEQLRDDEREQLAAALENRLEKLSRATRENGQWTANRRLTVAEYNHTLQKIFRVRADFADLLPEDPISPEGYRNATDQLTISSIRLEAYVDSARRAVDRYVRFGDHDPAAIRYHIELEDLFYSTQDRYGAREKAPQPIDEQTFAQFRQSNRARTPHYTDPLGPTLPGAFSDDEMLRAAIPKLNQQYIAIPKRLLIGECILRIRAAGTLDRQGRAPRMRVEAGHTLGDGCSIDKRVLGEVDVTASLDQPEVYEFSIRAEDLPSKGAMKQEEWFDRLSVFDMDQIYISNVSFDPDAIFDKGRGAYADPQTGSEAIAPQIDRMKSAGVNFLHLDCVEIEYLSGLGPDNGPYRHQLPPPPVSDDGSAEMTWATGILESFMADAFRRPVFTPEVASKLTLYQDLRRRRYSPEESLKECLSAVLLSPSFLFLEPTIPPGLSEKLPHEALHKLASRLSYLLWLEPPDQRLRKAAEDGSLARAEVLRDHTERLLRDPRHQRFLRKFCAQWLLLNRYRNVAVDRAVHPTYDDDFAEASIEETLRFFVEVFDRDANALDLLDSDYLIINDRLADHYDLDPVDIGGAFQRVHLSGTPERGGLLGQASILTMNSDGVDSHPVRRGVWLLERLLHDPPPPPPPNVPDLDASDPDFRGLTLQQKLQRHREPGSCQNCHRKIDPWGLVMENFDATGRWRETVSLGSRAQPIDASVTLPGGKTIANAAELKQFLRGERAEQFSRALVYHLLTYSLGRAPDFGDRVSFERIRERMVVSGFHIREGVLAIVESPLFFDRSAISGAR